eukprot:5336248-Pyramimonas_sp.AAC.1
MYWSIAFPLRSWIATTPTGRNALWEARHTHETHLEGWTDFMEEMLVDFLRKRTGDQQQLRRDAWNLDRRGLPFVEPQPGDRVDRPEIQ